MATKLSSSEKRLYSRLADMSSVAAASVPDEFRELGELVYNELRNGSELPKHIDAGQAMKEVRGILEIFTGYAHIEPARVIAYFEKIGAAGRQHRNLILHEYDWPARTGSDGF